MSSESSQYFSTPDLTGLIQQLKHLSFFSADALVVEADRGSGKSSLLRCLEQSYFSSGSNDSEIEPNIDFVRIDLQSQGESFDLIFDISERLGIPADDLGVGAILSQLRSYVESLCEERKVVLVAIDDAHLLHDDALGAVLSLLPAVAEQGFGLRLLLFAELGLMQRIDQIAPAELSIYDFQLAPFSTQELERFLSSRISGFDELQDLGKLPSIAAIWNRSGGRPGPALAFIQSHLSESSKPVLPEGIQGIPLVHLGILTILVAGLIFTLLYRDDDTADIGEKEAVESRPVITSESSVSAGAAEPSPATLIEPVESETKSEQIDTVGALPDQSQPASPAYNPVNTIVAAETNSTPDIANFSESGNDIVVSQSEASVSTVQRALSEDGEPSETPVEQEKVAEQPVPSEKEFILTRSERLLLEQPSGAYVLQLVAASKKDSLLGYIDKQINKDVLHMYRRVKGEDDQWYIVVIGPYNNKTAAESARSSLPANQREAGPWPKSIDAVRREINEFRDR